MQVVPGPGFSADSGLASTEEGLQSFQGCLAMQIAGNKFLQFPFDDSIQGSLPSEGQSPGLFQEVVVNLQGDVCHLQTPRLCEIPTQKVSTKVVPDQARKRRRRAQSRLPALVFAVFIPDEAIGR